MNKLRKKRRRVIYTILAVAFSNGLIAAIPSLELEIFKKLLLTFSNVGMFVIVWDAYFDEQLAKKGMISILQDFFAVTCLSIITTFILSQGITKLIESLTTAMGATGFGVAGAIAAILTAIIGVIWGSYCDDLYRNLPS